MLFSLVCAHFIIIIDYYLDLFVSFSDSLLCDSSKIAMTFISFKSKDFIAIIRSETSKVADFVANCGGLLGLFMGISMLSVVELVYFFSLRWCCIMKQERASDGSGQTPAELCEVTVIQPSKNIRE